MEQSYSTEGWEEKSKSVRNPYLLLSRDSSLSQAWTLLHDMASQDVASQQVLRRRIDFEPEKTGTDYFHRV